jgi:hypothetical protein
MIVSRLKKMLRGLPPLQALALLVREALVFVRYGVAALRGGAPLAGLFLILAAPLLAVRARTLRRSTRRQVLFEFQYALS